MGFTMEDEHEYLDWCEQWTSECVVNLKPNRMFIVCTTLKTETFLRYKITDYRQSAVLTPQNEIIWGYNWGGRSKTNFARKHEYAWCWSKGKEFLFNDAEIRVERKVKKNLRTGKDYDPGHHPNMYLGEEQPHYIKRLLWLASYYQES